MLTVLKDHTMLLWANIPLPKVMPDFVKFVKVLMLIILMDRKVFISIMAGVLVLAILKDHRETLLVMLLHSKGRSIVKVFIAIGSSAAIVKFAIVAEATTIATVAAAARYSASAPVASIGSPAGLIALLS